MASAVAGTGWVEGSHAKDNCAAHHAALIAWTAWEHPPILPTLATFSTLLCRQPDQHPVIPGHLPRVGLAQAAELW